MSYTIKTLQITELERFDFRDLRMDLIEKLTERITEHGYNPARPLTIVDVNNTYLVADGNHRLEVAKKLNIKELPCIIYAMESDPYLLASNGNQDENTYAPMDLFDWLHVVKQLKDKGLSLKDIGTKIGQSEDTIKKHSILLNKIVPNVLDKCKLIQKGRVTSEVPNGTFDFTEGWFRNSGLYDLTPEHQEECIEKFKQDKCNWSKQKLQSETAKYKQWESFLQIAESKLMNVNDLIVIQELIENGNIKTESQLLTKINELNKAQENKLWQGDATIKMLELEDAILNGLITDPPYGKEYESHRSKFTEHITKEGVENDTKDSALDLLDKTLTIFKDKSKSNAFCYIFVSWDMYHLFREVINKHDYLKIKNVLIWDKGNHGAGDLEGSWGNRYEMIIYAIKGSKTLNIRKADIISIPKINSSKMIHPTEKPIGLIKILLEVSAQPGDTIIDPFMGSGSTIKAIQQFDKINYIGIELDSEIFEKAKIRINS